MATGLFLLRVTLGVTPAAHGAQKLFGWFGGLGLDGTGQGLAALGFHPGRRHAFVAGLVELTGGLLLALGLATPLAATMFVSVMFVAAVAVHMRNGFFITQNGYEYTSCSSSSHWSRFIARLEADGAVSRYEGVVDTFV
jgi:putative oxidoreductase